MIIEVCPITELPVKDFMDVGSVYQYYIDYENEEFQITLGYSFNNFCKTDYFIDNRHLLAGSILTYQLLDGEENGIKKISLSHDWKEKFSKISYPKTPKEKLDNLLKTLYQYQNYDGEEVDIYNQVQKRAFWYKHFFKNDFECYYYFKLLQSQKFIDIDFAPPSISEIHEIPNDYQFTLKGLNYYLEITESGRLSNKCFVAMSFSKEMRDTREAIREAIKNTGYDTVLVDELHIDSDTTINDKIIAELKSAKFCIADFTEQRGGVYFESGFALGQGKPVIYCCAEPDFKDSHFDTKHFAHILYKEPSELKKALVNKINAWIK